MSDQQSAIADSTDVLGERQGEIRPLPELVEQTQRRDRGALAHGLHVLQLAGEAAPLLLRALLVPHAHEQTLQEWQLRVLELRPRLWPHRRRHVAADLREDADHTDLPQVGAISRAVGAEDKLCTHQRRQQQVVGDERRLRRRQRIYPSGGRVEATPRLFQRKQLRVRGIRNTDRPLVEARATCLSPILFSYTS